MIFFKKIFELFFQNFLKMVFSPISDGGGAHCAQQIFKSQLRKKSSSKHTMRHPPIFIFLAIFSHAIKFFSQNCLVWATGKKHLISDGGGGTLCPYYKSHPREKGGRGGEGNRDKRQRGG